MFTRTRYPARRIVIVVTVIVVDDDDVMPHRGEEERGTRVSILRSRGRTELSLRSAAIVAANRRPPTNFESRGHRSSRTVVPLLKRALGTATRHVASRRDRVGSVNGVLAPSVRETANLVATAREEYTRVLYRRIILRMELCDFCYHMCVVDCFQSRKNVIT